MQTRLEMPHVGHHGLLGFDPEQLAAKPWGIVPVARLGKNDDLDVIRRLHPRNVHRGEHGRVDHHVSRRLTLCDLRPHLFVRHVSLTYDRQVDAVLTDDESHIRIAVEPLPDREVQTPQPEPRHPIDIRRGGVIRGDRHDLPLRGHDGRRTDR